MEPNPSHANCGDTVVLPIGGKIFRLSRWHGGELPEYGFLLPGHNLGVLCEPLNRPLNLRLSSYILRTLALGYAVQSLPAVLLAGCDHRQREF